MNISNFLFQSIHLIQAPPSGGDGTEQPAEEYMNLTEILIHVLIKARSVFQQIWNHNYQALSENMSLIGVSFVDIFGFILGLMIVWKTFTSIFDMFGRVVQLTLGKLFEIVFKKLSNVASKILARAKATLVYFWNSERIWLLRRRLLFRYERVLYEIQERQKNEL